MAIFKFTDSISKNKKIELFNNGNHLRDFTHIDTFLLLVEKLIMKPGKKKNPFNVFNIGNGKSEKLIKFINLIEKNLKRESLLFEILSKDSIHFNYLGLFPLNSNAN